MCGQAGAFSTTALSTFELERVQKLLILNSFRGTDSTGAMWYHRSRTPKNQYGLIKRDEHPFYFQQVTQEVDIEKQLWGKSSLPHLYAVHCRAATVGKVEEKNAHPFAVDHIIGMHNGSIHSNFKNKDKFDTDSEALYHNIATMGVEEAIKELPASAAYALVWLDTQQNTLNFLRNNQRPLHVYHTGHTIYWSSDSKDLRYVFASDTTSNTTTSDTKTDTGIDKNKVLYFDVNTLYTVDLKTTSEISWSTKKIEPKTYVYNGQSSGGTWNNGSFFPRTGHGNGPVSRIGGSSSTNQTKTTTTNTSTGSAKHGTRGRINDGFPAWAYESIQWSHVKSSLDIFKTLGVYVKSGYNGPLYYAIELDMYFTPPAYLTLCLWRMANRDTFLEAVRQDWVTHTKAQQRAILVRCQLSRQDMKLLLRGPNTHHYIDKPYAVDNNGDKLFIQFMSHEILRAMDIKRTANSLTVIDGGRTIQEVEDAIDGVDVDGEVPFADDIPFSLGGEPAKEWDPSINAFIYDYGVTAVGPKQEINEFLKVGCCWCSQAYEFNDLPDLFWINNEQFICAECQDDAMDGHIQLDLIPRHQMLPDFVAERHRRENEVISRVAIN